MTEFEEVLQDCLCDLEEGVSLDECLLRHPRHAAELRPVLLASQYLAQAGHVHVSEEFKFRARARLMQAIRSHPRRTARSGFQWLKWSAGFAVVALTLLLTGTVYAQRALPGEAFYGWKLDSENVWRAVSSDPLGTDLQIAARRADELIAVRGDPERSPQALQTYLETAARLKSEANGENEARILPLLDLQTERLRQIGIALPQPDQATPPPSRPTMTPASVSPTAQPFVTQVQLITPTAQPTAQTAPNVKPPSKAAPALHSPPAIAPTTRANFP